MAIEPDDNRKVLKMKNYSTKNPCSKFFEPLPLYDDFNRKFGYEFVHHPELKSDVKDCLLAACKMIDASFNNPYDKEAFLYKLIKEAYNTEKLWDEIYDDFDIKTDVSKKELIRELVNEGETLAREFGINHEQEYLDDLRERLYSEYPLVAKKAHLELRGED